MSALNSDYLADDDLNSDCKNIQKFLHKFLVENQKQLNTKIITLYLTHDNPTEELYFWAKYATIEDLLKVPSISYIEER
jgi:hypothetical protein